MGRKRKVEKKGPNRKSYKGPFLKNKNADFEFTRKRMEMLDDGPTVNEITPIDTTANCYYGNGNDSRSSKREVSNKQKISNWFLENIKNIIIGVVVAVLGSLAIHVILDHSEKITTHDVQIEELTKDVQKNDGEIEELEDELNEVDNELKLLEQKVDFNEEKVELKYGNEKTQFPAFDGHAKKMESEKGQ